MNPGFPEPAEFAPFYANYIAKAHTVTDPVAALELQLAEALDLLRTLPPERQSYRYAPGKWSVKEIVNHLTDGERIFSYRALCVARNDKTPLPPFEENAYSVAAEADHLPWNDLLNEFEAVRRATIQLLRNFPAASLTHLGVVSNHPTSARALVYVIYGHVVHHLGILRERYLLNA